MTLCPLCGLPTLRSVGPSSSGRLECTRVACGWVGTEPELEAGEGPPEQIPGQTDMGSWPTK